MLMALHLLWKSIIISKKEFIPVGCVPPASMVIEGCVSASGFGEGVGVCLWIPGDVHPLGQTPLPKQKPLSLQTPCQTPPGADNPGQIPSSSGQTFHCLLHSGIYTPCQLHAGIHPMDRILDTRL